MSVEDLRKALEGRAKMLGNIAYQFETQGQVHFPSGYVAHKDDKLLLIDDVLDVLDDYVHLSKKELRSVRKTVKDKSLQDFIDSLLKQHGM